VFIYLPVAGCRSRKALYIRSNFRLESRGKVSTFLFRSLPLGALQRFREINGIEFLVEVANSLIFFLPLLYLLTHRPATVTGTSLAALIRETEGSWRKSKYSHAN